MMTFTSGPESAFRAMVLSDGFDGADLAGRILRRRLLRLGRQWKDESGQERQACCYSGYPRYSLKSNIHAINVDFVNTVMYRKHCGQPCKHAKTQQRGYGRAFASQQKCVQKNFGSVAAACFGSGSFGCGLTCNGAKSSGRQALLERGGDSASPCRAGSWMFAAAWRRHAKSILQQPNSCGNRVVSS